MKQPRTHASSEDRPKEVVLFVEFIQLFLIQLQSFEDLISVFMIGMILEECASQGRFRKAEYPHTLSHGTNNFMYECYIHKRHRKAVAM